MLELFVYKCYCYKSYFGLFVYDICVLIDDCSVVKYFEVIVVVGGNFK